MTSIRLSKPLMRPLAGRVLALVVALLAGAMGALPAQAAPLPPGAVPDPLKSWVPWVMHGHEMLACPGAYNADGERACLWPSRLSLDVQGERATFKQEVQVFGSPAWVVLPGEPGRWPQDVQADGQPLAVAPRDGRPAAQLGVGSHILTGTLQWPEAPQDLLLPRDIGSLQVQHNGKAVQRAPDSDGRLWLQQAAGQAQAADALTVRVSRLIEDDIPLNVTTQFALSVAGKPRELVLPLALLPGGFVPEALSSPLPARLADGGALRVQVRPGTWVLQVRGRLMAPTQALTLPAGQADEVWSFASRSELRVVMVEGMPSVDPKQVPIPTEWQAYPTYLAQAGKTLKLNQTRRGNPDPGADSLKLMRRIWLDFDGGGYTMQDRLEGTVRRNWRLEMAAPATLGRASAAGTDQPVTRLPEATTDGVELRSGQLTLLADSRVEGAQRQLPATGWRTDFESARAELNLPPGWRLLHASGVDQAQGSWVSSWTLWDFFFVLLSVLAAARLLGVATAAVVAAGLVLTWHMPDAPRALWLVLLGLLALVRVLPPRRWVWLERAAFWGARASVLLIALWLLPYAAQQMRLAIYPGLEQPHLRMAEEVDVQQREAEEEPPKFSRDAAAAAAAAAAKVAAQSTADLARQPMAPAPKVSSYGADPSSKKLEQIDPSARVQTGPGLPAWRWQAHNLNWQGPVQAAQQVSLVLLPPWGTALLRVGGVALLVLSLWLMAHGLPRDAGTAGGPRVTDPSAAGPQEAQASPAPGAALAGATLAASAVLALLMLGWPSGAAQAAPPPQASQAVAAASRPAAAPAALPDAELLEQLRQKLSAAPDCLPQCANLARLRLTAQGQQVQLRLELHALTDTMVPLPGQGTQWRPGSVTLDGRSAPIRRDANGALWIFLRTGINQVALAADVGDTASVEIALPMPPQEVQSQLDGWALAGLDARGQASGALSLTRSAASSSAAASAALGEQDQALPPFLRVERVVQLGLQWTIATRVSRVGESRAPARARIPLLAGEAVNSDVVRVEAGQALVQLGAEESAEFVSTLKEAPVLRLASTKEPNQIETWRLEPSAQWHVGWSGIAPVRHVDGSQQQLAPSWQPWPGETVELRISKPAAAAGQTTTLDRLGLSFAPGLRATDVQATGQLRSSQGSNHRVSLPEGVEFLGLWVDGQSQPIRPQGRVLTVPITPGAHALRIDWREPRGMGWWFATTPQGLGAAGANAHTQIKLPPERVVLATGGPQVGPAVLFWGIALALVVVAVALARTRLTPLSALAWFLLGLGLAQASLLAAATLAGWFFALAARRRLAEHAQANQALEVTTHGATTPTKASLRRARWTAIGANALQVLLVLWTLAAAAVLLETVRVGLLGYPDMMVLGNGSDASVLRWYQDRFADQVQPAWVVSVPVLAYRLLMLLWALWLAASVLKWVRWGWDSFSAGGLWRRTATVTAQ